MKRKYSRKYVKDALSYWKRRLDEALAADSGEEAPLVYVSSYLEQFFDSAGTLEVILAEVRMRPEDRDRLTRFAEEEGRIGKVAFGYFAMTPGADVLERCRRKALALKNSNHFDETLFRQSYYGKMLVCHECMVPPYAKKRLDPAVDKSNCDVVFFPYVIVV